MNESKESDEALKNLSRVHKLELEIQDIQRNVIGLYDKLEKHEIGSKERSSIEQKIQRFLRDRDEIVKDMEYEKRVLVRSLNSIDTKGDLDKFFE